MPFRWLITSRSAPPAWALVMVACLVGAVGWLVFDYTRTRTDLTQVQQQIALQQAQLARLNRLRHEVATFEQQKTAIDHRIQLISQLQANRMESQQLLDFLAQTVNGSPSLWLTGVTRKGNALDIEGRAASIDAVARFISELRRSGHFDQIQIKTTQQQPNHDVPTFQFSLAADFQPADAAAAKDGG
jgi:Tfp pilus assembly protein PilN